jgi:hypothetical protein
LGRTYPVLRREFILRLAEIEGAEPLAHAAEQLAMAALRFMKLHGTCGEMRMARASLAEERKRGVA